MNDFDLDRLAQVWQQEPPADELAWLERSAMRARSRGRAALWLEAGIAAAVAILMIALVWISPTTETMLAGSGAIGVLLLSQRRQRRLRAIELRGLTGSTEDMLDQSIARSRAALKRNWFSLIGMVPATLLGWLVAYYAEGRTARPMFETGLGDSIVLASILVLLAIIFTYLLSLIRRGRRELERLQALRRTYRREKEDSQS